MSNGAAKSTPLEYVNEMPRRQVVDIRARLKKHSPFRCLGELDEDLGVDVIVSIRRRRIETPDFLEASEAH